jgi:very-short-patch-repair endonuclease
MPRAPIASEAFLYRRLETLAATNGKFRLNAELPIPFDGWGRMDVDLLCAPSRIAIELDGGQHLGDTDAYRRDRRKDDLLQENGYLVPCRRCRQASRSSSRWHLSGLSHQGRRNLS